MNASMPADLRYRTSLEETLGNAQRLWIGEGEETVFSFLNRMTNWCAVVASLCLIFLMVITFLDVMGRYLFNAPIPFSVELIELGMGLMVCFGFVVTTLRRGHIAVDLVATVVGEGIGQVLYRIAALSGFVFFTLVAWRLADRSASIYSDGLRTQVLFLPVAPVVFLMTAAAGITAVIALYLLLARRGSGDGEAGGTHGDLDLTDVEDL